MAPSSSVFDSLPDEVLSLILGFVGNSIKGVYHWQPRLNLECAKDLFRAQLVCRRFEKLTHQIAALEWPLRNENEGRSLTTFLNHEHFSVDTLNLLVNEYVDELPHQLIFSGSLLDRLPETVNVFLMGSGDEDLGRGSLIYRTPDPETNKNIVEILLSGSSIRHFSIQTADWAGLVIIKMLQETPTLFLKHIDLSGKAAISLTALNNLLKRCVQIKIVKVNEIYRPEVWSEDREEALNGPKAVIVKSETLNTLELRSIHFLTIDIKANSLRHLNISSEFYSVSLKAPHLETFELSVEHLEGPVLFAKPCSMLDHLYVYGVEKSWAKRVVPLLLQCPSITSLTLGGGLEMKDLSVATFLSQLPSNVRRLSVDKYLLSSLGSSKANGAQTLSRLEHLKTDIDDRLGSFSKLQFLVEAMPNLQKLGVLIDSDVEQSESADIISFVRKEFNNIPELDVRLRLENKRHWSPDRRTSVATPASTSGVAEVDEGDD